MRTSQSSTPRGSAQLTKLQSIGRSLLISTACCDEGELPLDNLQIV
jgi:hypothetical protein